MRYVTCITGAIISGTCAHFFLSASPEKAPLTFAGMILMGMAGLFVGLILVQIQDDWQARELDRIRQRNRLASFRMNTALHRLRERHCKPKSRA